jgi:hypothetical protein
MYLLSYSSTERFSQDFKIMLLVYQSKNKYMYIHFMYVPIYIHEIEAIKNWNQLQKR